MTPDPKTWLDPKVSLWAALGLAFGLFAQAVTAQAKIGEHDRELTQLRDVLPAIRELQTEVRNLRTDVRDLRNSQIKD